MGKKLVSWSKVAPCQVVVVWQEAQFVPNPEARWFGYVVAL